MRALGPLVFASILAAVPVSDATQILPPREAPVVAPDQSRSRPLLTSGIGGRIVDARTGEPLRRVVVRVQAVDGPFSDVVMTGVDGRYEVRELPPGRYSLTAQRREYVPTQHGQTRFRQQGRPIELPAGTMLDIDLALPRGSVIWGHVVDEFGTPVVGARVTAESVQYAEGRPQLRGAGLGEPTDDLGRFRLFGLPPGEYYVSVEPPTRVIPGSPQAERMLAEERHVRTYYPGALVASTATPVRVGFDDEAGGRHV